MSRHLLIDRPGIQVVLGFDHMLRSFFGQIFNPSHQRRQGMAVGGWPTRSGLGTRRPAETYADANGDLGILIAWARTTQPAEVWEHPEASAHLEHLRRKLRFEWEEGDDCAELPVPSVLREGR